MDFEKALSDHKDLYLFDSGKGRALFRLLSYKKYNTVKKILIEYPYFKPDIEDDIWDECVVEHTFPTSKDFSDAGIVTTVSQLILFFSGPKNINDVNADIQEAKESLNDAVEQAILVICEEVRADVLDTLSIFSSF